MKLLLISIAVAHNITKGMKGRWIVWLLLPTLFTACSKERKHLFQLVSPSHSRIQFENTLEETDSLNILTVEYMYHGGGVAIADFNKDNLSDIFFTGNLVSNRLYLNEGDLRFTDVTREAGVAALDKWKSGVAVADVNNDGWPDIYVCATIHKDSAYRANMLFIHQGMNAEGIPVFKEQALQYGVADTGYSQNAAFLDYDKDGDLDLYVLQNLESDKIPSVYRPRILDGSALNNDRLYRNNGDGTFTDVTIDAGILFEGYGLGIAIADINEDGWPDIYIGNDYVSNDILYINNRDGTFRNEIKSRLKHQSLYTMGVDVADINNDLAPDIITLDMLPENNLRRKTISGAGATYYNYINNAEYGYEFQYMRNMLHINLGNGIFSEIGQMAGIHQTEWSWSSLLMDVDNDGYRDLFVTNGFPKDVTDRDYVMFKREVGAFQHIRSLLDSIPVLKVPNYAFQNRGGLSFANKTADWGLLRPSFSNGAAFADLDNDGDLDYIVNNINDPAFVYENTLYSGKGARAAHFLRIRLTSKPALASGAKIILYYGQGQSQYHDHSVFRGYLSVVEDIIHFGTGPHRVADSLKVIWPDGKESRLYNVAADQVIEIAHREALEGKPKKKTRINPFLEEVSGSVNVRFRHREWDQVDFYRQRTLPHKFSQAGPALAVGDVNNDGREDFIAGGSALYNAEIFLQRHDGTFTSSPLHKTDDKKSEDLGLLLFDADGDTDLDLYCVSGSYEGDENASHYQDRLYINDGKGEFRLDLNALPDTRSSGSCVRAADFDADGDLDLFVAGRVVPGAWPLSPESYLLRNDNGGFTNITQQIAPQLQHAGMITDALFTDFDNDGRVDLLVVGEFLPPTIFRNTGKTFEKYTASGLDAYAGWWNSLAAGDFDKDGDIDYLAGNLGKNNHYQISPATPLRVYAKDFDDNGSIDALLSCYFKSENGTMAEYPVHFWDELHSQSPKFRNQFSSYKQYGSTTMKALLMPYDTTEMKVLAAPYAFSSYLMNRGDGTFEVTPLPTMVQVAPINGMVVLDVNQDGNLDAVLSGNDYGNEVFSGRYDACRGVLLLGDGSGKFQYVSNTVSGFTLEGDGKALAKINTRAGQLIIATQNGDSVRIFKATPPEEMHYQFTPLASDAYTEVLHADGQKEKMEFYHGCGYLSQSSRIVTLSSRVKEMNVYDYSGKSRSISFSRLAEGVDLGSK